MVFTMYPSISDVMRVYNHKLKTFVKRLVGNVWWHHCKCSTNLDILFSPHGTFLELPWSGQLEMERLESQMILEQEKNPKDINITAKID